MQLLYSVRSERQLVERIEFDLLFRWFVGLSIDEKAFDASTFSNSPERLLKREVAQEFSVFAHWPVAGEGAHERSEHFSIDGAVLKAWASMKSFCPKDGSSGRPSLGRNGEADFRKTKRPNGDFSTTSRRRDVW